jgi:hypothetical protein
MRGMSIILLLFAVATACSSAPPLASTTVPAPAPPSTSSSTPASTSTTIAAEDFPAAALFLAAVDDALASTSYAGAAFEDPEGFLSTAVVFCDLLDQGLTVEETVNAYTSALIEASPGEAVEADDLLLGGVILGASIRLICPQHVPMLDELTP